MASAARSARRNQRSFNEWQSDSGGFVARLQNINIRPFRCSLQAFYQEVDLFAEGREVEDILASLFEDNEGTIYNLSSVELIHPDQNNGIYGVKVDMSSEVTPIREDDQGEVFWFLTNLREVKKRLRQVNDGSYNREDFLKERFLVKASFSEVESDPIEVFSIACEKGGPKTKWSNEEFSCDKCSKPLEEHFIYLDIPVELDDYQDDYLSCTMSDFEVERMLGTTKEELLELLVSKKTEEFKEKLEDLMDVDDFVVVLAPDVSEEVVQMKVQEFMIRA